MKREVAVSILVIALLLVGGLILFTNQSNTLTNTQATVTSQAGALDTQAANGFEIASVATQAAESNAEAATAGAATQTALAESLATSEANAEATSTRAAENRATQEDHANATQAALEDDLATNQADATQAAQTQSDLENDVATGQAEATELVMTATQNAILRVEAATEAAATTSALEQHADALEAQVSDLGALATQSVGTSANQSAMVAQAATSQADSAATISALEGDLATALAQPSGPVPTQQTTLAPTPAPTSVTAEATPMADVQVGSLVYDEAFNEDTAWFIGERQGGGNVALDGGQYVVTVDVVPSSLTVFSPQMVTDGYAEVDVDLADCPSDSLFGLFLRVQDQASGGYFFAFPCSLGFWAIVAFQEGAQPQVLNSGPLTEAASAGQHTIGVQMDGSSLSLYLDGELLGNATDTTYQQGVIGLYAESVSAEVVLRVDNFRVWELP